MHPCDACSVRAGKAVKFVTVQGYSHLDMLYGTKNGAAKLKKGELTRKAMNAKTSQASILTGRALWAQEPEAGRGSS
jgi:hypothetical protein